ncbi:MAG: hypothetical protein ACJASZ_001425 [Yoonia sp.]|jgi:hypothetical protein
MNLAQTVISCVALSISGLALVAVLWSVMRPDRRIWPPRTFGPIAAFVGWAGTLAFFAAVVTLGILGWGEIQVPLWLRYVVGPDPDHNRMSLVERYRPLSPGLPCLWRSLLLRKAGWKSNTGPHISSINQRCDGSCSALQTAFDARQPIVSDQPVPDCFTDLLADSDAVQ